MSNWFSGDSHNSKKKVNELNQVPILSSEEIKKLEVLKRASITQDNVARKSHRPSQHLYGNSKPEHEQKYTRKILKDETNDSEDTKMNEANQNNRKMRATQ